MKGECVYMYGMCWGGRCGYLVCMCFGVFDSNKIKSFEGKKSDEKGSRVMMLSTLRRINPRKQIYCLQYIFYVERKLGKHHENIEN